MLGKIVFAIKPGVDDIFVLGFNVERLTLTCGFLQWLPVTRAPQRFFPIRKTKFWWTLIKCFHDNSRVHFMSVSQPCSIIVGSGIGR